MLHYIHLQMICIFLHKFYICLHSIFTLGIYYQSNKLKIDRNCLNMTLNSGGFNKMKKAIDIMMICLLVMVMFTACGDDGSPANNDPAPPPNNNTAPLTGNDPAPPAPVDNFDTSRMIAVYTREDGSGTRDAFVSLTGVGDDMTPEAVVDNDTNQILTKVAENAYAIGYVSVGSLNENVKALQINGITPSDATIMDGTYTLQRDLLICVTDESAAKELVADFIAFMLSAEGQVNSAARWTVVDANAPAYTGGGLSGTLKVGGSTSVEPLMQRMRDAYIALNPDVDVEISGGGSGTGITQATEGMIDIGMSSRNLRDNEKENLTPITIALDGVAVIVNPSNPVTAMTIDQVREIFTGEVTRWNQAG